MTKETKGSIQAVVSLGSIFLGAAGMVIGAVHRIGLWDSMIVVGGVVFFGGLMFTGFISMWEGQGE